MVEVKKKGKKPNMSMTKTKDNDKKTKNGRFEGTKGNTEEKRDGPLNPKPGYVRE